MGNGVEKNCRSCMKLETDQIQAETRFMQITDDSNKSMRCKKFFISSQSLQKHKINQLLIFTDSTLTLSIPNFNLKLDEDDLEKLQETFKYEIYNSNLVIRENCFVLNAIQQQIDSQYGQFRQQLPYNQNSKGRDSQNVKKNVLFAKVNREKLKSQIQQFTLRNKSRAFRFRNPLRKYNIGHIIVAIVPIYQKSQDLIALKQAVEQGLSMSQDLKSVGVSQISFMLGYELSVFQKIILEYILGYSKPRKGYVFKRMSDFLYSTNSNEQISNFFRFLNVYTNNKLEKVESVETLGSQHQRKKLTSIRRLGSNKAQKSNIVQDKQVEKKQVLQTLCANDAINKYQTGHDPAGTTSNLAGRTSFAIINNFSSISNTSSHGCAQKTNPIGFDGQKDHRINSQRNVNASRRSFANEFVSCPNDTSGILTKSNQNTQVKNIRFKSFKSKESNVSDYF